MNAHHSNRADTLGPIKKSGVLTSQAQAETFEIKAFFGGEYKLPELQGFVTAKPLDTMRTMRGAFGKNEGAANQRRNLLMVSALHFAREARDNGALRERFFAEPIFSKRKNKMDEKRILQYSMQYLMEGVVKSDGMYNCALSNTKALQRFFDEDTPLPEVLVALKKMGKEHFYRSAVQLAQDAAELDIGHGNGSTAPPQLGTGEPDPTETQDIGSSGHGSEVEGSSKPQVAATETATAKPRKPTERKARYPFTVERELAIGGLIIPVLSLKVREGTWVFVRRELDAGGWKRFTVEQVGRE